MAASTRSIHSRQPGGRGQGRRVRRRGFRLRSAGDGGGGYRPYSRKVGRPENSRAALELTRRSNKRRAARSVIGAWRAASAVDAILGQQQLDDFCAGLARNFGATARRVAARRARSAARSRAATGASAIARAAAFGQALVAALAGLPYLTSDWDPEPSWRSAEGAGPSAAGSR